MRPPAATAALPCHFSGPAGERRSSLPLLDLRIDYHDTAVAELSALYERSQLLWAQAWRDELAERPILNREVA